MPNFIICASYKGYEIGHSSRDSEIFVSKDLMDSRYKKINVSSLDDAYEYIDSLHDE